MIPISFGLKYEGITKREHGKIMRLLMRNMMTEHVQKTLPDHFESGGKTRAGGPYGYQQRSRKYMDRKRRKYGHAKPLVYTGKLKRQVLSTASRSVRATQFKATSRPTGTRVAYKDSTRPLLSLIPYAKKEVEAFSRNEVKQYARKMEKQYVRTAERLKTVKQIRRAQRGA